MAEEHASLADSAVSDSNTLKFSPSELRERVNKTLGGGASGAIYSLKGFPKLVVREIRLDGMSTGDAEAAKVALTRLTGMSHPGVLRCHQVVEDGDFIYVVMDRYQDTLEKMLIKHMRAREPVSEKLLFSILGQIASALVHLHDFCREGIDGRLCEGIGYRSLTPASILVSKDKKRVVLADFGLCKGAMTNGTTKVESPAYMAPETLLEGKVTPTSDIWSLGVIVYELAALSSPSFVKDGDPQVVFTGDWRPNLTAIKSVRIKEILGRILVPDPEARPSAKELVGLIKEQTSVSTRAGEDLRAQVRALSSESVSLREELIKAVARIDEFEQQLANAVKTLERRIDCISGAAHASKSELLTTVPPASSLITGDSSWTDLMRAAANGNIEVVKKHLADKDKKNSDGETALMIAARAGHADVVELLDPTDEDGVTALMRAAEKGTVEDVALLIKCGANKQDNYGYTALMYAAENGHTECVKLLAEQEAGMQDEDGWTALMWAAQDSHVDCVRLLLEKESGMRKNDGVTSLMVAAAAGSEECIPFLLQKEGCMRDNDGWTALAHAAEENHSECVRLLMKHESSVSGWTSLICAAYLGDVDAVRDNLHEKGRKDITGLTALMWAAQKGHKGVVKVLLEHEKGAKNNQNHSSLYYALKSGHIEAAKIVIPHEDPTDENGVTALMRAAARGDAEMVELLAPLQKGAKDKDGNTALVFAARAGQGAMLELLDPPDCNGVTALMRAASRSNVEAVRALIPLQKGKKMLGDIHINGLRISSGTALMMAAAHGHAEAVKLLVGHEGGAKDGAGRTALMVAAQGGHAECIKLLLNREAGMRTKTATLLS